MRPQTLSTAALRGLVSQTAPRTTLQRPLCAALPSSRSNAGISTSARCHARVVPVYGASAQPPEPPLPAEPSLEYAAERIARRRRKAELLRQAAELRGAATTGAGQKNTKPLRKRFWRDVHVKEVDGKPPSFRRRLS